MRIWPHRSGQIYRAPVDQSVRVVSEPRTIAVTSGKGGAGKTSFSVNLALCLAKMDQSVTLFDADLGMANIEVLLGLIPPYSLYEVLYGEKTLKEIAVRGPMGINIISGGAGLLEMANLDHAKRRRLLQMLNEYSGRDDFLIIDTGAGINKNVLGFLAAAGEVIVVVTPEPTSLTDAYALIKVLANFKVHSEVGVVVNRATDRQEAARTLGRIQSAAGRFLEIKLNGLGWIPEDRLISQAIKKQQPFFLTEPNAPASRGITGIAEVLLGRTQSASNESFWSKLMGLFS